MTTARHFFFEGALFSGPMAQQLPPLKKADRGGFEQPALLHGPYKLISISAVLERRYAHRRRCILDWNREPNTDEKTLLSRIQNCRDDADYFPSRRHESPTGTARINCGVELYQIRQ